MNLEKKLQKSRLGEAYAGIHSDADRQAVLRAYDALLKENDLSNKMLAQHMAGSILPSVENTQILVELRDYLNETYGFCITTLSGGSTCTLGLLEAGTLPAGINQLRVGEGVLFGEDTTGSRFLEGCHHDAFTFRAQVVELRRKPSVPIGEHGRDGKGDTPEYPDRGVRLRAICAAGKQDVAWAALTPTLPGAWMIGASSDHLIVDVEDCGGQVRVGDWMEFRCGYMAVLDATTSAYVDIVVK